MNNEIIEALVRIAKEKNIDREYLRDIIEEIFGERRCHILQDVTISVTIDHVIAEVLDYAISSILFDMVVDPSQENVFIT